MEGFELIEHQIDNLKKCADLKDMMVWKDRKHEPDVVENVYGYYVVTGKRVRKKSNYFSDRSWTNIPIKLGKKKYKNFKAATKAVMKKKKLSKDKAAAYVATVERTITKRRAAKRKSKK